MIVYIIVIIFTLTRHGFHSVFFIGKIIHLLLNSLRSWRVNIVMEQEERILIIFSNNAAYWEGNFMIF